MTEHTPLPWKVAPTKDTGKDWLLCYVGSDYEGMEWIITTDRLHASECNGSDAKDDADFIVKAVNNHDKLIRMLKLFISLENVSSEKHALLRLSDCGHSAKALLEELK